MEEILSVYERPPDPAYPLICLDEASKELHTDSRVGQPPAPGQPARQDYEYGRHGTANLFLWVAPLLGQRRVRVTAQHTAEDFAEQLRLLVDVDFPAAKRIVLVTDNLNTHGPWALYGAFPPEEARRLVDKVEWHYTPEHGSWLNMAEIELSVLRQQCLDRRIADAATLEREVAAWEQARNAAAVTIDWQFRLADARIKLIRLYPILKPRGPAACAHDSQI